MNGEIQHYVGHDEPWREWRTAMAGERMHHGWILAGRRGVGKMPFALAAARELVAEPGVPQPGEHPDIIILTHLPASAEDEKKRVEGKAYNTKRSIAVEQIREMQRRLTTRPTLGRRRAIIIDPADDLEKPSANALLKSLEEPPQGTFFLLIAHRPGRLLATIRSRCRMLRFPTLDDADIDAILTREVPQAAPETRSAALAAAAGSPGAALDFVELDLGRIYELMRRIVGEGDPHFALRGELAETMGQRPARERQVAVLDLARGVLAREAREAAGRAIPPLVQAHAALVQLTAQVPTYNFDPGLLVAEIGNLLASASMPREAANG